MKSVTYIYGLVSSGRSKDIRYIGKTVNLKNRLWDHLTESKNTNKNSYKCRWIRKELSKGNKIKMILIDTVWTTDWDFWEIYWISEYKRREYKLTNLSPGGELSHNMKEITVLNLNNKIINTFKSIREASGYYKIPENNIRDVVNGRKRHVKNKIFIESLEYDANKDYSIDTSIRRNRWKTIYQFNLDGEFIKEWKGIVIAAKSMNTSTCVISAVLNNKQQSSSGYIWSYSSESPQPVSNENVLKYYDKSKNIITIYNNGNYIGTCNSPKEISEKYGIPVKNVYRVLCKDMKSTAGGYTFIRETEGVLI